jgi:hypothetical protein
LQDGDGLTGVTAMKEKPSISGILGQLALLPEGRRFLKDGDREPSVKYHRSSRFRFCVSVGDYALQQSPQIGHLVIGSARSRTFRRILTVEYSFVYSE